MNWSGSWSPFALATMPCVRGQYYLGWKGSGTPWSCASSENIPCLSSAADQYILGHAGATSKLTLSCAYMPLGGLSRVLCAHSVQLCLTLCNTMDCSLPGSSCLWDFPGKNTGVGCRVSPVSPALQADYLPLSHWKALFISWKVKVPQSCPTLWDSMDCSLLGSSIHGILQARVLEWAAISFSNLPAIWLPLCSWKVCECVCMLSCVQLFVTPWTVDRLLCPWEFPGKNIGVGSHSLLQGIFPTQGSNPSLLHCRQILYYLSRQGNQRTCTEQQKNLDYQKHVSSAEVKQILNINKCPPPSLFCTMFSTFKMYLKWPSSIVLKCSLGFLRVTYYVKAVTCAYMC